jgi:hypothetical protein
MGSNGCHGREIGVSLLTFAQRPAELSFEVRQMRTIPSKDSVRLINEAMLRQPVNLKPHYADSTDCSSLDHTTGLPALEGYPFRAPQSLLRNFRLVLASCQAADDRNACETVEEMRDLGKGSILRTAVTVRVELGISLTVIEFSGSQ